MTNNSAKFDGIFRNCTDAYHKEFTEFIPDLYNQIRSGKFCTGSAVISSFLIL